MFARKTKIGESLNAIWLVSREFGKLEVLIR